MKKIDPLLDELPQATLQRERQSHIEIINHWNVCRKLEAIQSIHRYKFPMSQSKQ